MRTHGQGPAALETRHIIGVAFQYIWHGTFLSAGSPASFLRESLGSLGAAAVLGTSRGAEGNEVRVLLCIACLA